jgi:hypothetical protein
MFGALLSICNYSQNVGGPHAVHHLIRNGKKVWDLRRNKIYKKVFALNLYYSSSLYVCIKVASIIYKDSQFWNVLHKTQVYIVW